MKKILKISIQVKTMLTICLLVFCAVKMNAQVYVPASNPENLLFPSFEKEVNNAIIDYSPNCGGFCGNSQLKAVTWASSIYQPGVLIVDDGVTVPDTINIPNFGLPDVIIGNNRTTSTDYLVGLVFVDASSQLNMYIYDIANVGTGAALSINLVSSQVIAGNVNGGGARIDIIADYGNSFLGLPLCDKFVIAYSSIDSITGTGTYSSIKAYYSSLNNPTVSISTVIEAAPINTVLISPDVAAIQRLATGVNDLALICYINPGDSIFYQEWNINLNTVSSPLLLDNVKYGDNQYYGARIAAIDDYNINSPSAVPPLAYYTVAYTNGVTYSTYFQNKIYNNYLPIPGGLDISTPYLSNTGTPGPPIITTGPCQNYTVMYGKSIWTNGDLLAQNINWATGYPVGYNSILPNPFTNVDYYQVNFSYPQSQATDYSIGATCNGASPNYAPYLYSVWNDSDNMGYAGMGLYDKVTDCTMAFKTASVPKINKGEWSLSPNPATDVVILTGSSTVQNSIYSITDIMGRTLQHAPITSVSQQIDVSAFAPGMYLLNVYSSDQKIKTIKFVKD